MENNTKTVKLGNNECAIRINEILCPDEGSIFSSIKIVMLGEKGVKVKRVNQYYNGEEFFLAYEALEKSSWRAIPNNTQLPLL